MPSRQFETIPPHKAEAQPTHEMDGSETTELQQAGGGQSAREGSALLQLQHTHGNRHVQGVVKAAHGGNPLPADVRQKMEGAFGQDFGDVRIHEGDEAAALDALAYAQGSHIYFDHGEYRPHTAIGWRMLGHELAHVVQQRAGRVAVPDGDGAPINSDAGLEREADALGQQVAEGKHVGVSAKSPGAQPRPSVASQPAPIQRLPKFIKKMLGLGKYRAGAEGNGLAADVEDERDIRPIGETFKRRPIINDDSSVEHSVEHSNELWREEEPEQQDLGSFIDEQFGKSKKTKKIRKLLHNIAQGQNTNLSIQLGLAGFDAERDSFDFAERAAELDLDVPAGLTRLERAIRARKAEIGQRQADLIDPLITAKAALFKNDDMTPADKKTRREEIDAEIGRAKAQSRQSEAELAGLIKRYQVILEGVIRREVLRDLIQISKTDVGSTMLTSLTQQHADPVAIRAYHYYKVPDAGSGYVNYTPQYFKNRDTTERQEGGAIRQFEALKALNPWQENDRTDITLFHELVHAYHYQTGTDMPPGDFVSAKQARHAIDSPRETDDGTVGVPKEEYATVGLGEYAEDVFTENAYRRALQALDQDVALRTQYQHLPIIEKLSKPPKRKKKAKYRQ